MRFGYARVSTHDKHHDLQLDALVLAGCERIFTDICSGATACADRPQLQLLRAQLRAGDVIVIWELDRLGQLAAQLEAEGADAGSAALPIAAAAHGRTDAFWINDAHEPLWRLWQEILHQNPTPVGVPQSGSSA